MSTIRPCRPVSWASSVVQNLPKNATQIAVEVSAKVAQAVSDTIGYLLDVKTRSNRGSPHPTHHPMRKDEEHRGRQ